MLSRSIYAWLLVGGVVSLASPVSAAKCKAPEADSKSIVETAVAVKDFSTLVAAVKAADLVETLSGEGPFTVFAPTNEAFAKLPEGTVENLLKPENKDALVKVLTYHVVAGTVKAADVVKLEQADTVAGEAVKVKVAEGKVMINQAQVVKTDIACANGVIHVIDSVLLPESLHSGKDDHGKPEAGSEEEQAKKKDIVDTAASSDDFSTLVSLVKAAGLVETLKGEGPFTVFAPSDQAFGKLPKGTVNSLLKPENKDKLAAILTLHVVKGKVMAADVVKLEEAEALGGKLMVKVEGDKVMINKSRVVTADVECANGVIHIIDAVLLP